MMQDHRDGEAQFGVRSSIGKWGGRKVQGRGEKKMGEGEGEADRTGTEEMKERP